MIVWFYQSTGLHGLCWVSLRSNQPTRRMNRVNAELGAELNNPLDLI